MREVFEKVGAVIGKIRRDKKPRLVELMTYRWHGHMEGEPESYRSAEEKERYKKAVPDQAVFGLSCRARRIPGRYRRRQAGSRRGGCRGGAVRRSLSGAGTLYPHRAYIRARGPFVVRGRAFSTSRRAGSFPSGRPINEALAEEMERDGRVFIWGEDVTLGGYFNVTEGLVDRFGSDRVIDTPISENGIIGGAVGAAITGLVPVPEILFSDFLTCAMDPILNQAAKIRYMTGGQVSVPLTIRTPVGGGIGMAAQHSQSMERFFFGIPGLITVAPSDPYTAKGILKAAIRSQNPVIVFEHKLLYPQTGVVPDGDYTLPLGKARIVRRGDDVTIVTHLLGVGVSLEAAKLLDQAGIQAEIVDLVTLYPLDMKTVLDSLQKTGTLVCIEEGSATGGIGSEVIARTARAGLGLLKRAPVLIAAPECPIAYAKGLETAMIPSPEFVADEIRRLLAKR